jgi:REP element-mobilizing transposase RayT
MSNIKYNPQIHHRRSIRFREYDYSQSGFYFLTLCTKERNHLFGEINNDKMLLNNIGLIVKDEWEKTPEIRKNVKLGKYVIMPNHFHAIFQIEYQIKIENNDSLGKFKSPSQTVGAIMRGFKGATTLKINKHLSAHKSCRGVLLYAQNGNNSIWQRNYWEHIIRTEIEHSKISQYIIDNPVCWDNDKLNGGVGNFVLEEEIAYNQEEWMI